MKACRFCFDHTNVECEFFFGIEGTAETRFYFGHGIYGHTGAKFLYRGVCALMFRQ